MAEIEHTAIQSSWCGGFHMAAATKVMTMAAQREMVEKAQKLKNNPKKFGLWSPDPSPNGLKI